MTAAFLLGGALFAACIAAGAAVGVWSWWWPRRRLAKVFAASRRARCAANVTRLPAPTPVVPVVLRVLALSESGAA